MSFRQSLHLASITSRCPLAVCLQPIQEYFGLSPGFPLASHLVCRTLDTDRPKRLYLVSDRVKDYLLLDQTEQLKIIATGLKVGA